ncbi:hypothetical protein BgiMline_031760 [Biomphalaria glabrata]
MMADIAGAEASKDGHIAARIIFPNGIQVIRQLPLLDRDGDDMTFGEMADISRAEASKDGHIAARIIYPNGSQRKEQLPLVDKDGDDMTYGEIKKKLLAEKEPGLDPNNYNLVLIEENNSIMPDGAYILDSLQQLLRKTPPTFTFQQK